MMRWIRGGAVAAVVVALLAGVLAGVPAEAENEPLYNDPEQPTADIEYYTTRIGPFTLDANGGLNWQDKFEGAIPKPDIDIPGVPYYAVKSATFDLVTEGGESVPREDVHLHHFVIATAGSVDPACPTRTAQGVNVRPHLGTGAERTPIAIPDPYAMKVWDSEIWGANWHLMNMSAQEQTFYIEYTLGVQPEADNTNTRWATPWFLDIEGSCGGADFDVPGDGGAGSVWTKSKTWDIPDGGVIVGTGGHVHDGGLRTELRDGEGDLICKSDAVYKPVGGAAPLADPPAHAEEPPPTAPGDGMMLDIIRSCATHWELQPGEDLTLTGFYDNSKPQLGQMGINLTFIWNGEQSTGVPTFPDVPPSHTFFDEVAWGTDQDITKGYADGMFQPTRDVSRQAILAWLHRLSGSPAGPFGDPGFNDVAPSHPFYDPIAWAAAEGIVNGWPDGTFRSTACVSRQALVTFLYRLAGSPPGPFDPTGFTDVPAGSTFAEPIAWAAMEDFIVGYDDGTFRPTDCVTRQAAMAILYRYAAHSHIDDLAKSYADWIATL